MNKTSLNKLNKLRKILQGLESCVLAYSGGVDSTLLLKVASEVLGDKILTVTADSEVYSKDELKFAKSFAKSLKVRHLVIKTAQMRNLNFVKNQEQRCFYCKRALFMKLKQLAKENNFKYVIDAVNMDDNFDFRPGIQAARALKVRSPLAEAGLGKKDIYALSKYFNLPTQNKPSLACLASRFPYGEKITLEKLLIVNNIESFIRSLGVKQVRLRHHGKIARIEVNPEDLPRLVRKRALIVNKAKKLGYNYVSLDLEGYRTGSLNEAIANKRSRGVLQYAPTGTGRKC